MLSLPYSMLGTVGLTLLTTAEAAGPGFVQYDIFRRENTVQSTAVSSLTNLLPMGNLLYTINITVGTPPQSMMVVLDTGSSDLEILTTNVCSLSQAVCNPNSPFYINNAGSYSVSASSTAQFISNGMVQFYADTTQFSGSLYTDTVGIAGVSVENMTVAIVQSASAPSDLPIIGILGIGFAGEETEVVNNGTAPYPTLLMSMKAQGLINSNTYSLYLNDINAQFGSILFGGIDDTKYTGSLEAVPILNGYNPPRFLVPWTSLIFSTGGTISTLLSTPVPALLDSGTAAISLTPEIASSILTGLGLNPDDPAPYILPCFYGSAQADFTFGFNNDPAATIDVPLSSFLDPLTVAGQPQVDENGDALCQLLVDSGASGSAILGDPFMRAAYLVFDLDNNVIAMAQAVLNSTTSNVQAIDADSGIGATTVATTVTASALATQTSVIQNTAGVVKPTQATVSIAQGSPTFKITATGTASASAKASASHKNTAGSARGPAPISVAALVSGLAVMLSVIGGSLLVLC